MLTGTIITLDARRCVGEVEVENLGRLINPITVGPAPDA